MKDLFIIHISPSFAGGVGTFTKNLINYQLNEKYKIAVVTYDNDNSDDRDFLRQLDINVEKIIIKKHIFNSRPMLTGIDLHHVIKKICGDNENINIIVHVHNPATIGVIQNIKKYNIVCTIHGINVVESKLSKSATNYILKRLYRSNKELIAVSKHTSDFYNKELSINTIKTIYNGVSIKNNNNNNNKNKNREFTIGYVSRLVEKKGWELIIKAMSLLKKKSKGHFKLIICGEGNTEQVKKLNNLISQWNLEKDVDYLGYVPDAGDSLMPILDLFVLPSESEGLPMSVLEALGHGIPVLATPVGGIPEVIIDDFNGKIISRDPEDIAKKIDELFINNQKFAKLKNNALESYVKNFTIEKMGLKYDQVYKSVIEKRKHE